ncbi:hypothetical protein [Prochlorococcus marinus]|nr:hypothetical protein [Prochlorococcus marinus]
MPLCRMPAGCAITIGDRSHYLWLPQEALVVGTSVSLALVVD